MFVLLEVRSHVGIPSLTLLVEKERFRISCNPSYDVYKCGLQFWDEVSAFKFLSIVFI